MTRVDSTQTFVVDAPFQEFAFDYSGNSAEVETGGVRINFIPKEGGNRFATRLFANFSNDAMQGSNIDDALKRRGLLDANRQKLLLNTNITVGGPIRQDRIWFFGSFTGLRIDNYAGGTYYNTDVTAFTYVPDLSRQAVLDEYAVDWTGRVTWQATPRDKIGVFHQNNVACQCHFGAGASGSGTSLTSPEASRRYLFFGPVDAIGDTRIALAQPPYVIEPRLCVVESEDEPVPRLRLELRNDGLRKRQLVFATKSDGYLV